MGLDVSAYAHLTPVDSETVERDEDGLIVRYDDFVDFFYLIEATEAHWSGRTEGLAKGPCAVGLRKGHCFRAGSYGSYNQWRQKLAALVDTTPEAAWSGRYRGPFWELINFSDCEGVIGPVVSAKLAKDFRDHRQKAEAFEAPRLHSGDEWFISIYRDFQLAFEIASAGGAVQFH